MAKAERFVDEAASVCREARESGIELSIVFLHAEDGPPVLVVDSGGSEVTDEFRLGNGIGDVVWRTSPVFAVLREQLAVVGSETVSPSSYIETARRFGYTGPAMCPFAMPLLGARGWFGTVVHGNREPLPIHVERRLALRATAFSVWCTERGIGRVPRVAGGTELPARRYRIAQLASQGLTNAEIAQTLDISINTVKSRLKQVFAQLSVDNRTELATVIRRLAPVREVPLGITRMDGITITRVAHQAPEVPVTALLRR